MCKELITIALCAPETSPSLSFTCGKLHMVAAKRETCPHACGNCLCFFGTCSEVEKVVTTATVDLSELQKVRCLACTLREDNVGDRRTKQQLVDSPLLARKAVSTSKGMEDFRMNLNDLWGGKSMCPFHPTDDNASNDDETRATQSQNNSPSATKDIEGEATPEDQLPVTTTSTERRAEMNAAFLEDTPIASPSKSSSSVSPTIKSTSRNDATKEKSDTAEQEADFDGIKMNVGLTCSRWAKEKPPTPKKTASPNNRIIREGKTDRAVIAKTLAHLESAKQFLKGY